MKNRIVNTYLKKLYQKNHQKIFIIVYSVVSNDIELVKILLDVKQTLKIMMV